MPTTPRIEHGITPRLKQKEENLAFAADAADKIRYFWSGRGAFEKLELEMFSVAGQKLSLRRDDCHGMVGKYVYDVRTVNEQ